MTKFTGKCLWQSLFFNKVAGLRPLLKRRLWYRCFPGNFAKVLRTPFLENISRRLLLLRDFNFQAFSIIYFISPTIKDHNIKCICSKCFREGITNSWIYYQFVIRTVVKNLPPGTVVNKYFNNKQKHTNGSARKELLDFNKRQWKKEYCSRLFLRIFPLWFSTLNNLFIIDSLIGIMKAFVSSLFTMLLYYTLWNYRSNLWFLMFSGSIKGGHWEEISQAF